MRTSFSSNKERQRRREILEQLVNDYSRLLLLNARMYLKDEYLAEDIVQEVWLFVWEFFTRLRLDDKKALEGYLLTMVKHKCLNLIRKRARERSYDLLEETNSPLLSLDDTNPLQTLEYREALEQCANHLKREDLTLLYLRFHYGLTYREIAAMLQLKEPAVRQRVSRARKRLQKKYPDFVLTETSRSEGGRDPDERSAHRQSGAEL